MLLAPAGLALGMAMPIGLTRLPACTPDAVPWAWAVNGIASVLASVLAVAVAITWGFAVVTLLALACYLVALVDAVRGRLAGIVSPFARRLILFAVVGLAARVAYGLATKDPTGFKGDALWYHLVANNLADGHGYVAPFGSSLGRSCAWGSAAPRCPRPSTCRCSRPCSRRSRWWDSTARRRT